MGNIFASSQALRLSFLRHSRAGNEAAAPAGFLTFGHFLSEECPVLERVLAAVLRDEFDIQQEAVRCLEQACLEPGTVTALLQSGASQLRVLSQQLQRVLRTGHTGGSDAAQAAVRIIAVLVDGAAGTAAAAGAAEGKGRLVQLEELLQLLVEVGVTEALDDLQVPPPCACVWM